MDDHSVHKSQILSERTVEKLASSLHGRLVRSSSEGYDSARQVFNAMIRSATGDHNRMCGRK